MMMQSDILYVGYLLSSENNVKSCRRDASWPLSITVIFGKRKILFFPRSNRRFQTSTITVDSVIDL